MEHHYRLLTLFIFVLLAKNASSEKIGYVPFSLCDILDTHNTERQTLGINSLSWDHILEQVAREEVEGCRNNTLDTWRFTRRYEEIKGLPPSDTPYVGYNWIDSDSPDVSTFLSSKEQYDCSTDTCSGGYCYQYKQVVWANATGIGCSIAQCSDSSERIFQYLVCLYSPSGDVSYGGRPYPCEIKEPPPKVVFDGHTMDDKKQNEILNIHNNERTNLQIETLKWNPILEQVAIEETKGCGVNTLDSLRFTQRYEKILGFPSDPSEGYIGYNWLKTDAPDQPDVSTFLSSKEQYDCSTNSCNGGYCYQYKQVVWANATDIGCSIAQCIGDPSSITPNYEKKFQYLVCLYSTTPRGDTYDRPYPCN